MNKVASTLVCLSLALGLALPLKAVDVDVTGKWSVTTKSPRGERTSEMSFLQEGEKLTVTSKDRQGNEVKSLGTVKGTEITWTTKRQTPMGEITITHTGKVEGNSMAGTMSMGEGHTGEWKAAKVEK
jgi:hypothetical protein